MSVLLDVLIRAILPSTPGGRPKQVERARRELERLARLGLVHAVLFERAADQFRQVVPFDGGCWHTLDPATLLITSHWTNLSGDGFPMIVANEYGQQDIGKFSTLAGRPVPASALSGERLRESPRFLAYRERGWGSELRATLDVDHETYGAVMLLRSRDLPAFTPREARLVAALGSTLARGLRASLARGGSDGGSPGAGLVVLDRRDQIESCTPAAVAWLGDLEGAPVPPALLSVSAAARGGRGSARARVRATSGQWLVLQGTLLDERSNAQVAVVVSPARPAEVAPLLVSAYGLTPRERDVLREVLRGRSTGEIAQALHLVPYTVQDHLKSIFEKTGASSRAELVARLFFEQFEPRLGDPLAADGFFAG
jgi:DNA-binding CsgD family transcriptional regulator